MEKSGGSRKGKVLLATVKGDVHDIGKNLVEIILSNNGYEVVNLGIKVPPEKLVEAYGEHRPDLIGLSGLLVKSAQQMVTTAQDLTAAGVVLRCSSAEPRSRRSSPTTDRARLRRPGRLRRGRDARPRAGRPDPLGRGGAQPSSPRRRKHGARPQAAAAPPAGGDPAGGSGGAQLRDRARRAAAGARFRRARSRRSSTCEEIWQYVNPHMLYAKHLGLRGSYRKLKEAGDPKLAELEKVIEEVQASGWIRRAGDVPVLSGALGRQHAPLSPCRGEARRASRSRGRSRASGSAWPTSSALRRRAPPDTSRSSSRRRAKASATRPRS